MLNTTISFAPYNMAEKKEQTLISLGPASVFPGVSFLNILLKNDFYKMDEPQVSHDEHMTYHMTIT